MKLSIWWPTFGNSIRMGGATSRMGGATSFPYLALPSRFKSLLNAHGPHLCFTHRLILPLSSQLQLWESNQSIPSVEPTLIGVMPLGHGEGLMMAWTDTHTSHATWPPGGFDEGMNQHSTNHATWPPWGLDDGMNRHSTNHATWPPWGIDDGMKLTSNGIWFYLCFNWKSVDFFLVFFYGFILV